jgi:hypothetical protein
MGLCGAQDVTFVATLESSSECSRWRRIVVLDFDQYKSSREKQKNSRFCDHVSLEQHFIKLPLGIDEVLLRFW